MPKSTIGKGRHREEERVQRALEALPRRQQERLVRTMGVILEVFGREELANLLECVGEA